MSDMFSSLLKVDINEFTLKEIRDALINIDKTKFETGELESE